MEQKPMRVLQIGMTRNIGGLETYLMQQFDHLDKSKVIYDFVNITSEYDIVFHDHIVENGGRVYGVRSRHSNPLRHYWQWIKLLHQIAGDYKAIVLNSNSLTYVFPIFIARFFNIPAQTNKALQHLGSEYLRTNIKKIEKIDAGEIEEYLNSPLGKKHLKSFDTYCNIKNKIFNAKSTRELYFLALLECPKLLFNYYGRKKILDSIKWKLKN